MPLHAGGFPPQLSYGHVTTEQIPHYTGIGESCSNDGQLRLTQTASVDLPNAGRVEICAAGSWGTIAASSIISPWSEKNAQVACVELGFSGALNSIFQHTSVICKLYHHAKTIKLTRLAHFTVSMATCVYLYSTITISEFLCWIRLTTASLCTSEMSCALERRNLLWVVPISIPPYYSQIIQVMSTLCAVLIAFNIQVNVVVSSGRITFGIHHFVRWTAKPPKSYYIFICW